MMTLEEAIKHCEERSDCTECGAEHRQLAEWLRELKERRELSIGWIPVEERLPDEGGTYFVTAKENELYHTTFAKWQSRYRKWDLTGARSYWRVIAWMPLPEPYKTEK